MSTQTTNYGLIKPATNDFYDISVQNSNMDVIDAAIKQNANGIAGNTNDISTLNTSLSTATLIFTNKTVAIANFISDSTYSNYLYKAVITCDGVTTDYFGEVAFDVIEAVSGNFAPVCLTGVNTITIYAKNVPSTNITIPSIKCTKVVAI